MWSMALGTGSTYVTEVTDDVTQDSTSGISTAADMICY